MLKLLIEKENILGHINRKWNLLLLTETFFFEFLKLLNELKVRS